MTNEEKHLPEDLELIKFVKRMHSIAEKLSYRELNLESYFQEILVKENRNEDEEFIFIVMLQTREYFGKIQDCYDERMKQTTLNFPEIEKKFLVFSRYFDWDNRRIHLWEYNFKYCYFPIHVGNIVINGWLISTVWLGLDHSSFCGKNDSKIFETMIFKENQELDDDEEFESYLQRYSSLSEAKEGHKNACNLVKKKTLQMIRNL